MRLRRPARTGGGFLVDGDAPSGPEAPQGRRVRAAGYVGLAACGAAVVAVLAPLHEGSPDGTSRMSIGAPRAVVLVLDDSGGGRSARDVPGPQRVATVRLPEEF